MAEARLPRTDMRDLRSRQGRDYRIFISIPDVSPGPAGYPVLYLLDGNATFAMAAASASLQARRPESTQVGAALIVGIGYPTDGYLDPISRTYDYTPDVPVDQLPARPDGSTWPTIGGATSFLSFIEDELKPLLGRSFAIDAGRQTVFGHSFGGLFVLHTLFTRPHSFQAYIAASPSVWFAKRAILSEMDAYILRHKMENPRRKLLVTVGSLERSRSDNEPFGAGAEPGETWRRRNRMIENATDIVRELSSASGSALDVSFQEFPDENHSSVLPVAVNRALRFALAPQ